MRRKYVFFDIDHTLVSYAGGEPHIPKETREAVALLKERGHIPAIATGRGDFLSRTVARELGIELLVCANGAQIRHGGGELYSAWLPDFAVHSFLETASRYPDLAAALDERFLYTDNLNPKLREYFEAQAGYPCLRPLSGLRRALMCYLMVPPPELRGENFGLFTSPPDGVRLERMHYFIEARAAGTTKWQGIRLALACLGAEEEDAAAFGDGVNDAEMLRHASPGVAVGKSSPEAREAASLIAGDIDEGGILNACRELGLIAPLALC